MTGFLGLGELTCKKNRFPHNHTRGCNRLGPSKGTPLLASISYQTSSRHIRQGRDPSIHRGTVTTFFAHLWILRGNLFPKSAASVSKSQCLSAQATVSRALVCPQPPCIQPLGPLAMGPKQSCVLQAVKDLARESSGCPGKQVQKAQFSWGCVLISDPSAAGTSPLNSGQTATNQSPHPRPPAACLLPACLVTRTPEGCSSGRVKTVKPGRLVMWLSFLA